VLNLDETFQISYLDKSKAKFILEKLTFTFQIRFSCQSSLWRNGLNRLRLGGKLMSLTVYYRKSKKLKSISFIWVTISFRVTDLDINSVTVNLIRRVGKSYFP